MGKRPWEKMREQAAEALDLPGDVVAGLPRMELIGSGEFWMHGHRGILSYGGEEIHISGGKMIVCLRGRDLELRNMSANILCITGDISGVELE